MSVRAITNSALFLQNKILDTKYIKDLQGFLRDFETTYLSSEQR